MVNIVPSLEHVHIHLGIGKSGQVIRHDVAFLELRIGPGSRRLKSRIFDGTGVGL
jgi:hypothetical protein